MTATARLFLTRNSKAGRIGPMMINANEMVNQLLDLKTRYEKATKSYLK